MVLLSVGIKEEHWKAVGRIKYIVRREKTRERFSQQTDER